ncbi:MAG TPA: SRPBCC family protein [Bryobacteraceae bacterium]|nr:SRPBCC family protein [Bryobacteraceae bacterium]
MTNRYHFITRWRVKGAAEDVYDILSQPLEYSRWWPSVYLIVKPEGKDRVHLRTKGWLPYTLSWDAQTVVRDRPKRLVIEATGDFDGRGIWSIVPDGDFVDITFDWKLAAEKPLLRRLSFLLRPVFEANHRWAMEQGRKSLELELERFRAMSVEEMNAISPPPGPMQLWTREGVAGIVIAAAVLSGFWKSRSA